jgi:hypothetical protein
MRHLYRGAHFTGYRGAHYTVDGWMDGWGEREEGGRARNKHGETERRRGEETEREAKRRGGEERGEVTAQMKSAGNSLSLPFACPLLALGSPADSAALRGDCGPRPEATVACGYYRPFVRLL